MPSAIPAKAVKGGNPTHHPSFPLLRHSREGGNPQFPRTREFIVPLPQHPKKYSVIPPTPSFPRRRESIIPAHAGIHRPLSSHYPNTRKNTPSIPVPLPQHPKKYSVIPAKAGIHNSRARGNSTRTPSRPTRHIIPTQDHLNVIPAKAGMTECFSRALRCWGVLG